jgi:hypothetical protein
MERREAIQLFREICECIPDSSRFHSVFLNSQKMATYPARRSFELRIDIALDKSSLRRVEDLVRKRRLAMEENKGALVIYAPETSPMAIVA